MNTCWTHTVCGRSRPAALRSLPRRAVRLPNSWFRGCACPDCFFCIYVPQKFGRSFGEHGIDKHSRTKFKTRGTREARNHTHVPVKMAGAAIVGRAAANRKVKVGVLQPNIELG